MKISSLITLSLPIRRKIGNPQLSGTKVCANDNTDLGVF